MLNLFYVMGNFSPLHNTSIFILNKNVLKHCRKKDTADIFIEYVS